MRAFYRLQYPVWALARDRSYNYAMKPASNHAHRVIAFHRQSSAIEGIEPPPDVSKIEDEFLGGQLSEDEFLARLRATMPPNWITPAVQRRDELFEACRAGEITPLEFYLKL